jgi:serine/threonine protein kinase
MVGCLAMASDRPLRKTDTGGQTRAGQSYMAKLVGFTPLFYSMQYSSQDTYIVALELSTAASSLRIPLSLTGNVVLGDFGLATDFQRVPCPTYRWMNLSMMPHRSSELPPFEKKSCGTPMYMAAEILAGSPIRLTWTGTYTPNVPHV